MKILVLTKRQYTNKDLIDDQYGRLWEIPQKLSTMGHEVKGVCLSYRKRKECGTYSKSVEGDKIEWFSFNLIYGFLKYLKCLKRLIRDYKPDIILASSDCYHVIWGVLLGKLNKIPCLVDLYDNYESYKLSKTTRIIPFYRYALERAEAISCVSNPLEKFTILSCQPKGEVGVIGNAVDKNLFYSRDLFKCRDHFGLSKNIKIIGTAGRLFEKRGINNLYRAFEELAQINPNLYLAVVGVGPRDDLVFQHSNIIDLGVLGYDEIPFFFNMLDVAVICNKNNDFGLYCYPQKANEILACEIPIVAANVGVMAEMLSEHKEHLFDAENWGDLVGKIQQQLLHPKRLKIRCDIWSEQAKKMEDLMEMIVNGVR